MAEQGFPAITADCQRLPNRQPSTDSQAGCHLERSYLCKTTPLTISIWAVQYQESLFPPKTEWYCSYHGLHFRQCMGG